MSEEAASVLTAFGAVAVIGVFGWLVFGPARILGIARLPDPAGRGQSILAAYRRRNRWLVLACGLLWLVLAAAAITATGQPLSASGPVPEAGLIPLAGVVAALVLLAVIAISPTPGLGQASQREAPRRAGGDGRLPPVFGPAWGYALPLAGAGLTLGVLVLGTILGAAGGPGAAGVVPGAPPKAGLPDGEVVTAGGQQAVVALAGSPGGLTLSALPGRVLLIACLALIVALGLALTRAAWCPGAGGKEREAGEALRRASSRLAVKVSAGGVLGFLGWKLAQGGFGWQASIRVDRGLVSQSATTNSAGYSTCMVAGVIVLFAAAALVLSSLAEACLAPSVGHGPSLPRP